MPGSLIKDSFKKLENYCSRKNWVGWDPYDGLNSVVFKKLPVIRDNVTARLIWIQLFKKNPVNLRRLLRVPQGYNTKGLGLFLSGYCNIFNVQQKYGITILDNQDILKDKIIRIADLLLELQSPGYSGACWGYNFDWQSKAFFLPVHTPTVVATAFVAEALIKAYGITGSRNYLDTALSSADFILKDLNRIPKPEGFMFSYSPLDDRAVYNASLLGTKTLSLAYPYTQNELYKEAAYQTALAVCRNQNEDGSFPHSDQVGNSWRDNFHTAFKLESLAYYQKYCSDSTFCENLDRGFNYWIEHFFDKETGIALYYENNYNLIDLHCAAQSMPALYNLNRFKSMERVATKVITWAVENMQDEEGYFYFQKTKGGLNKIAYMRWPNAWMFYGMSYYILGMYEI